MSDDAIRRAIAQVEHLRYRPRAELCPVMLDRYDRLSMGRRAITHIEQADDARCCGQACVAMYLGIPLTESFERFGHSHGTRTKEVLAVLGEHTSNTRATRISRNNPLPHTAMVRMLWVEGDKLRRHWVLKVGQIIKDPSLGQGVPITLWEKAIAHADGRATSFLCLEEV